MRVSRCGNFLFCKFQSFGSASTTKDRRSMKTRTEDAPLFLDNMLYVGLRAYFYAVRNLVFNDLPPVLASYPSDGSVLAN